MSYEKKDNRGEENPKSEKSIYVRDSLIKPPATFLRHHSGVISNLYYSRNIIM